MPYKHFLELVTQLNAHGAGKLLLEDHWIDVKLNVETKKCLVRSKVFSCFGPVPPFISDILTSRGALHWNQESICLKRDEEGSVYLEQEIEPVFKYVYVRSIIKDFVKETHRWKNFFHLHAAKANYLYSLSI